MKNPVIRETATEELRESLKEQQALLNKLTLNHAVSPVENPQKIRITRKTIARILTELKKRELAETK